MDTVPDEVLAYLAQSYLSPVDAAMLTLACVQTHRAMMVGRVPRVCADADALAYHSSVNQQVYIVGCVDPDFPLFDMLIGTMIPEVWVELLFACTSVYATFYTAALVKAGRLPFDRGGTWHSVSDDVKLHLFRPSVNWRIRKWLCVYLKNPVASNFSNGVISMLARWSYEKYGNGHFRREQMDPRFITALLSISSIRDPDVWPTYFDWWHGPYPQFHIDRLVIVALLAARNMTGLTYICRDMTIQLRLETFQFICMLLEMPEFDTLAQFYENDSTAMCDLITFLKKMVPDEAARALCLGLGSLNSRIGSLLVSADFDFTPPPGVRQIRRVMFMSSEYERTCLVDAQCFWQCLQNAIPIK